MASPIKDAVALLDEIVRQAGLKECDYAVIEENARRLREHLALDPEPAPPSGYTEFGKALLDSNDFGYTDLQRYRRGEDASLVLDGRVALPATLADFVADLLEIEERPASD